MKDWQAFFSKKDSVYNRANIPLAENDEIQRMDRSG